MVELRETDIRTIIQALALRSLASESLVARVTFEAQISAYQTVLALHGLAPEYLTARGVTDSPAGAPSTEESSIVAPGETLLSSGDFLDGVA